MNSFTVMGGAVNEKDGLVMIGVGSFDIHSPYAEAYPQMCSTNVLRSASCTV
jgi:hypothetical protein